MAEAEAHAAALKAFQDAMGQSDDGQSQYSSASEMDRATSSMYGIERTDYYVSRSDIEANEMKLLDQLNLSDLERQELFQGLIGGFRPSDPPPDDNTANDLLRLLQQQQIQQEINLSTTGGEDVNQQRPDKHYLTIAQNGTVLEATQTVTGFLPEDLLMTSVYDSIFDEDLPGFLAIKTQFWDKGQTDVDVYVRRRSIEGDWIWLSSKAVTFINNDDISGIILEESLVTDEPLAKNLNRVTRIIAILVQAVEAAWLQQSKKSQTENESNHNKEEPKSDNPLLNDDVEAYQLTIARIVACGMEVPENAQDLENLMRIVANNPVHSGRMENGPPVSDDANMKAAGARNKAFDPNYVIESVRRGVSLDLGLTKLYPDEVKLITLVLSGKIAVDQVASLVLCSLRMGKGLRGVIEQFSLEGEKTATRFRSSAPNTYGQPYLPLLQSISSTNPPPVSVINLSCSYIGNHGVELFSNVLYKDSPCLKTIDLSFCKIEEKGFLALARAISRRKRKGMPSLKGVILTGNYLSPRSASEIGTALAPSDKDGKKKPRRLKGPRTGYETDSAESEDDDDDEDFGSMRRNGHKTKKKAAQDESEELGLQVLHVSNASMTSEAVRFLLEGLGANSTIQELNLSSNNFGAAGATAIVTALEAKTRQRTHAAAVAMPFLDRLDLSNNNLGDDGTTQLTRAISKRTEVHLVDLRLSSNNISAMGIETIMNKLLQHSIISLSLDKNNIGDQGCQLVAASLHTMKSLSRLNLGFNQIGSRGITSLMRSLVDCESITYLGLSGNILRISGAISLAFMLLQHPRLEELDLDNCCLGQAAQCHIVAGIISNRWVPMKRLRGYAVGPPMAAIGALETHMVNLNNEECLRIRKDEQMKTILQWMEDNRTAKRLGGAVSHNFPAPGVDSQNSRFLTPDFISSINDVHGTPSQNAYFRLLGWLGRIPFDEAELTSLQNYFYDTGGGDGDRGSDGYINLKLRGDLLAALDGEAADEIREELPMLGKVHKGSVGIDLDKLFASWNSWAALKGAIADAPPVFDDDSEAADTDQLDEVLIVEVEPEYNPTSSNVQSSYEKTGSKNLLEARGSESSYSISERDKKSVNKVKPRITMFPLFEQQLAELKATATEMIEQEEDPMQHEIILTQYAEASLTILRQLRYHCMNSGLDGWRQSGLKRKVLIVDDSKVTRKLVSRAFEKANFIVDTASNGKEGVDKLKASLYDIAFMDIDMPVMNGFEATKKLREWEDVMRPGARQPICALTAAYVDDFERSELMKFKEAGLDVMESKPCNIPRLFKVVDDVSPMFSDLSITVMQRERSESSLQSGQSY